MRMTSRKKKILSYFEPDNLEWVTGEIGAPPLDVSGVAYLLHGMESFDKRHQLESTRRIGCGKRDMRRSRIPATLPLT